MTQPPPHSIDGLNEANPDPRVNAGPIAGPDLNDDPIVAGLRTLYQEVLLEKVPDEFQTLLAQIDAALEAEPTPEPPTPADETEKEPGS